MIKKMGFLFGFFVMTLLTGISSLKAEKPRELYPGKVTIGITVWTGYLPLLVAQEKKYFEEAGLNVEIKLYAGLEEISREYVAGKLHGRGNLTLDAVKESLQHLDHRVVLALDYSDGADAIIAVKGIETVKDFRGKRVAYEKATLEEFFLTWALTENEMSLSDIVPVFAGPEEAVKKLKNGETDAAVSFEPFISQSLQSGDYKVVYSSKDAPGLITDIMTFRTDFITAHPETVEAILRVYFKALQFWKDHPEEANAITAEAFKDTTQGIAQQLEGIRMLDEKDNKIAFTYAGGLRSLYGNLREIGRFVRKYQGEMTASLDTDKLVERRFIKDISEKENS